METLSWFLNGFLLLLASAYVGRKYYHKYRQRLNTIDFSTLAQAVPVERLSSTEQNNVEEFWTQYTVRSKPFQTRQESLDHLTWRAKSYPLFHELTGLWGDHEGETVLDYGCGPANDVVGFLEHSKAKKIIGMDVSQTALDLASHRMSFHSQADLDRVRLIHVPEKESKIPLPDQSVDYIYCGGVLHHTSNPQMLLKEFHRILKVGGKACVMVYYRDSLWMHYFVIYEQKALKKNFEHLDVDLAYARSTDDPRCPISRCYRPDEFLTETRAAGFNGKFVGTYFSPDELIIYKKYGKTPLECKELKPEYKEFFQELTVDAQGYPTYRGIRTGNSGVYLLNK